MKREKERKSAAIVSGTGFARNSRAGGVNEVAVNYVYKNIFGILQVDSNKVNPVLKE
ncbi:MAG: hypothetical protein ACLURP_12980 [Ruminococcus sp.]